MAEITMKSTKAEILEAYNKAKEELETKAAQKYDPLREEREKTKVAIEKEAKETIESGILNPEIVTKYNNVCADIANKESWLKELYGIEAKTNSLVSMINAYTEKEAELKERYAEEKAEFDKKKEETLAKCDAELKELEEKKKEILKSTREDNAAFYAELKKNREREEEEYAYNLKRSRQIENDKWEDEKAEREKAVAKSEDLVCKREEEVAKKEQYLKELEEKVAEIDTLVATAKEEGIKKGKADAEKSHAFEIRSINTKHDYEVKNFEDQIEHLTNRLESEETKNFTLEQKLDAAYAQMKELATETVKSTGSVKIVNGETTSK